MFVFPSVAFITVFNDPNNIPSENLHNSLGYTRIFRVHYSPEITNDVKFMLFKKQGKLVMNFLKIFNTKLGMLLLAIMLKSFQFAFPSIILYNEKNRPRPNIKWILKNFEKI